MKKIAFFILMGAFIISAVFITGCDTESAAANNVSISPSSAVLQEGESVTFTASGGYDYTWSLSNSEWGTLTATSGNTTTYKSAYAPATNETAYQVLTVTSTIEGSSTSSDGSSTNGSSYAMSAEVYIEHYSPAADSDETNTSSLSISPTSASLTQWSSQEFTASGGSGTYSWSIENSDYGLLSSESGSTVSYTSSYNPDTNTVVQTVMVVDSDGASTTASVIQTE